MKVLFKRIEKCEECPYFRADDDIYHEFHFYCDLTGISILYPKSISKDCPLPDEEYLYEEKEEE